MAGEISKSKQKSVIVVDFTGPGQKFTELGRTLADNFSTALAKSNNKYSVIERTQITGALARKGFVPSAPDNVDTAVWIAAELKIQCLVSGEITLTGDTVSVEVRAWRVDSTKLITGLKTASSITDEMQNLIAKIVEYPTPQIDSTVPVSGNNGYTLPSCVYCPQAQYNSLAIRNHREGIVVLTAVVGADGKAHDIVVIKPLPDGLTEKAVEAVESWRFNPAKGPDGNPATVRRTIEVNFHIYNSN
jgi:TonB family protein